MISTRKYQVFLRVVGTVSIEASADSPTDAAECQKEIEICERDPDWCRYASHKVANDQRRARERFELRHYEYYNYEGHRYWISVQPEEYEILTD